MNKPNAIAIDLAKDVFQVAVISKGKVKTNRKIRRKKLAEFLARQPKSVVSFEACSGMHYWGWVAQEYGHEVKAIPAKVVAPYRQGHKTDPNDTLAIYEASERPELNLAPIKTVEQLELQSMDRIRTHLVDEKRSLSNHIRGVLSEYGITMAKSYAQLKSRLPEILEDGENRLPMRLRHAIGLLWRKFLDIEQDCKSMDRQVEQLAKDTEPCRRLLKIEGMGPVGATLTYATLGNGSAFANGRNASAYVGLTPKQHSTGGKTVLISIGKICNRRLRSVLIQGARSVVHKLKEPKTAKERWLWEIIQRCGHGKAAVALANKNIRTAWAMLQSGEEYQIA
jgi:transposase